MVLLSSPRFLAHNALSWSIIYLDETLFGRQIVRGATINHDYGAALRGVVGFLIYFI
jgi:hypothetical protein